MIRNFFSVAIIAGVLTGLVISIAQEMLTTPLILQAEKLQVEKTNVPVVPSANENKQTTHEHEWMPNDGLERIFYTSLSNVILGVGYALILIVCFGLSKERVDGRIGVIWGLAGFVVFALSPAVGFPPELPGTNSVSVDIRQVWWIANSISTIIGLWLIFFQLGWVRNSFGLCLLVLPHLFLISEPTQYSMVVPPELAGHFVSASLGCAGIFWSILGWSCGSLYSKLNVEI